MRTTSFPVIFTGVLMAICFPVESTAYEHLDFGYFGRITSTGIETWEDMDLKGSVKTVTYDDGTFFSFTSFGKLTESKIILSTYVYTSKCAYDSLNRITSSSSSITLNGKTDRKSSYKYVYDDINYSCAVYRNDTSLMYTLGYDKLWRINKKNDCIYTFGTTGGAKGKVTYDCDYTYIYDENGRLIEKKRGANVIEKYYYYEDGKIKTYEKWDDNKVDMQYSYGYNSTGGLAASVERRYHSWTNEKGLRDFTDNRRKFTMTYDTMGNWTSAAFPEGAFQGPMSRTISYY